MKPIKFHTVRKETFYSIECLPNTFLKVSFDYFPLGKLLRGNEYDLIFSKLYYLFLRSLCFIYWIFHRTISVFIHPYGWCREWNFYDENWYSTLKLFSTEKQYIWHLYHKAANRTDINSRYAPLYMAHMVTNLNSWLKFHIVLATVNPQSKYIHLHTAEKLYFASVFSLKNKENSAGDLGAFYRNLHNSVY